MLVIIISILAIFFIYNNFFKTVRDLKDISLIKNDIFINTFTDPRKWQSAIAKIDNKKNDASIYKNDDLIDPFLSR